LNAIELGAYRVGANGVLLDEISVPDSVYLGTSLLQVVGYAPNMTLRTVNVSVDVTDRAKIQLKTITLNVYYKEKKPNHLLPEAMKKLERLVKAVPASAKLTQVKLTGWAAAESGVEYPWSWGIDRAKAVKSQLRKLGLKANYQIKSKGVSVRTNYLGRLVQISIQYALWD
jgi:outer membrane protein OmpA-like peptidoglycan-associated protein